MISNSMFFLNGFAGHQVPDCGRYRAIFQVNAVEIRHNEIAPGSGHAIDERESGGAGSNRDARIDPSKPVLADQVTNPRGANRVHECSDPRLRIEPPEAWPCRDRDATRACSHAALAHQGQA